ncbi:hypothetical protein PUMCH_002720 [Australozyma saopauloensis]|uniref:Uncharacterized protein n=1 Tax=Australozyma saopauloensis TaxID=291208 RepID=A0AAX4HBZ0_9ASCO|nr:hypothetical protein PUMCH_002720 [[Candida] saopauloensis]
MIIQKLTLVLILAIGIYSTSIPLATSVPILVDVKDTLHISELARDLPPGTLLTDRDENRVIKILEPEASGNVSAQVDTCSGRWAECRIAQLGDWWSPWYKISDCHYNNKDFAESDTQLSWKYSYSWLIEEGPVEWSVLNLLLGGDWESTVSTDGSWTCFMGPGDKCSVWYQTKVKWGDVQVRTHHSCEEPTQWSEEYHFDVPFRYDPEGGSTNLGYSYGSNSHCD